MSNHKSNNPAKSVITFNSKLPKLTKNQLEVLDLLIEAACLISPIYEQQENHKLPGANFYPQGLSKLQIEKAAEKDPQILSPYTVVEREGDKLVATPYHVKYLDLLRPVVDKLEEAADTTDDKDFSRCLKIQAKALLDGDYDKAQIAWMKMKPYVIDINIGPIERYNDKLFFIKTSYQSWVGIMDEHATERVSRYKDIILSARKKSMMPSERVDYYDKVQIRVDDILIFAGFISRTTFVGVNLPNDVGLTEKYGSEITMFKQVNERRVKEYILPTFNKLFSPSFKQLYSEQDISDGAMYFNVLHEIAHTYLRYRNAENRLQDLFPVIDELAAYVTGIRVCGSLLLKDMATQHQLESIMVAFLSRAFNWVLDQKDDRVRSHYVMGGTIFINYLLENEAIAKVGGVSWPNFTKMYFAVNELSNVLERMLSKGSRKDAEKFISQYGDLKNIQKI